MARPLDSMQLCVYGSNTDVHVSLPELLKAATETGDYWARAEYSGSEACYIEVARWSEGHRRWERYAFEKVFTGDYLNPALPPSSAEEIDWKEDDCCAEVVRQINAASRIGEHAAIIHRMPTWGTA